jgi:hypothetical protein
MSPLLTHDGHQFEKIAYVYDPTQEGSVWAHKLVNRHDRDAQTAYPVAFRLWEPAEVDVLDAGLRAAGVSLRAGKYPLKESAPPTWRTYLLGVWRRHQHTPAVGQLSTSTLLIAQQLLEPFVTEPPDLSLPVTFDNG